MQKVKTVLKAMRDHTHKAVPFQFAFVSHNETKGVSNGLKTVKRALLRKGYSPDNSDKSEILIAYTDLDTGMPGFFYAPLLMQFNNTWLCDIKM